LIECSHFFYYSEFGNQKKTYSYLYGYSVFECLCIVANVNKCTPKLLPDHNGTVSLNGCTDSNVSLRLNTDDLLLAGSLIGKLVPTS